MTGKESYRFDEESVRDIVRWALTAQLPKDICIDSEHITDVRKYVKGSIKEINLGAKYMRPMIDKKVFSSNSGNAYVRKKYQRSLFSKVLNFIDGLIDFSGDYIPEKSTLVICSSNNINDLKFSCGLLNSK